MAESLFLFITIQDNITIYKNVLNVLLNYSILLFSSLLNQICVQQWLKMFNGARCSFMVEHPLMVQWVNGLIPHSGPIELFLVPASVP